MSKYADNLLTAIWADPWFLGLPPEAKTLYLWAISSSHTHVSGLCVVARPVIEMETGLKAKKFDAAVQALGPSLQYHESSGTVWVRGSVQRARNQTDQIAKSIVAAVNACPHRPFALELVDRYQHTAWLTGAPAAKGAPDFAETHVTLTRLSPESRNGSNKPNQVRVTRESPDSLATATAQAPEQVEEKTTTTTETVDAAPDDLPAGMLPVLTEVKGILDRIVAVKGGTTQPSLRSTGRVLARFPRRDHVAEAEKLEHWLLDGNGRNQANKDIVARYRTWLGNAADSIAPRRPVMHDPAAMRADLQRRLAEDER